MALPDSYRTPEVQAALTLAATETAGKPDAHYRALVGIFLLGGNDAHNTVMPLNGANRAIYDIYRSEVGIPVGQQPMNQLDGKWRLHHNLTTLSSLYQQGKMAVLMNVGPLTQPITRTEYLASTKPTPPQLHSHNSQVSYWQGLPALGTNIINGWMGRAADLAGIYYNTAPTNSLPTTYSLSGAALQMNGYETVTSVLKSSGPDLLNPVTPFASTVNSSGAMQRAYTRSEYGNPIQTLYSSRVLASIESQASLATTLAPLPPDVAAMFDGVASNSLAQQLRVVVQIINSRAVLNQRRQLFYATLGGFDNHKALRQDHDALMAKVDEAISVFWMAISTLSLTKNVTAFTESDFGRALLQNGSDGVDHGWGGHHFVIGGAVTPGLYGVEPDFTVGGQHDIGEGRLLPTTSVEEYAGALLEWWGIPYPQLSLVLPNLANFPISNKLTFLSPPPPVLPPDYQTRNAHNTATLSQWLVYDPNNPTLRLFSNHYTEQGRYVLVNRYPGFVLATELKEGDPVVVYTNPIPPGNTAAEKQAASQVGGALTFPDDNPVVPFLIPHMSVLKVTAAHLDASRFTASGWLSPDGYAVASAAPSELSAAQLSAATSVQCDCLTPTPNDGLQGKALEAVLSSTPPA